MKICVFGAGAEALLIAARLVQGGAAVSLIAQGDDLEALGADGLRAETADGSAQLAVTVAADPGELEPHGMAIVAGRHAAADDLARGLRRVLRPAAPVLFIGAGIPWWYFHPAARDQAAALAPLDPGGALAEAVAPRRVLGGVLHASCTRPAPGVVRLAAPARLVIGEIDGRLSPRAGRLAELLRGAALAVTVSPRIRDAVWQAVADGAGPALVAAILGAARGPDLPPDLAPGLRLLRAEIAAIAAAHGCAIEGADAPGSIEGAGAPGWIEGAGAPGGIADAPAPIEAGALPGLTAIPCAMARLQGVATPLLDLLRGLAQARTAP